MIMYKSFVEKSTQEYYRADQISLKFPYKFQRQIEILVVQIRARLKSHACSHVTFTRRVLCTT